MDRAIGIVGGGQLGRMITQAALPLGFNVIVVDPNENCSAAQAGATQITADLYDKSALRKLAELSDFLTVEIEHLDTSELERLAGEGAQINPSPQTVKLIQDKFEQKRSMESSGIPLAPYRGITSKKQAQTAFEDFGGDMFIKARHGAYDGRGNMHVASKTDLDEALKKFAGRKVYAEKRVPFKKELAVMVAKSLGGETAIYPVVETVHERSICLEVLAPAEITKAEYRLARQIASEVANQLDGAGVFGIEMFLTDDGGILVNEIAPRVHNSGHYTIEACYTSQFEQHVRAITGLPLGDASMSVPAAVMINILGERNGPVELSGLHEALKVPKMAAHVYGKSPTKIDRKMGHLTATAQTVSEARARARTARKIISI